MSRLGLLGLAVFVAVAAVGAALAGLQSTQSVTTVGPMHLVSPGFGYVTAQRTVQGPHSYKTWMRLLVFEGGRWRNATLPALRSPAFPGDGINEIDDVDFVDRRIGWTVTFNCANAAVQLYRTNDGGLSWRSLGQPTGHSCSLGTTYLSFIDSRRGWMEPVSPNGPVGGLLETSDGGRSWKQVATTQPSGSPGRLLPCLAPIRFVSRTTGWMGRCDEAHSGLFQTTDGGWHWRRAALPVKDGRYDVPWFEGRDGVEATTVGTKPLSQDGDTRAVVFSASRDGGRTWTTASRRQIGSCPLGAYDTTVWPASVASGNVWWIVAGTTHPTVQLTGNGGRTWRTVTAHDLPARPCSVMSVSAAGPEAALVVAHIGGRSTEVFRTDDGGREWRPVTIFQN